MNAPQKNYVSVIIPTYNSARYLAKAIDSVLAQTYQNYQIIVIDDGSSDNTKQVLKPYLNKILYVYKENGGPASARNLGILNSKGKYIAFLDADDLWLPKKLELQIRYFEKNSHYGLIHSNTWVSEKNFEVYPFYTGNRPPSGQIFRQLFFENHINNNTVVLHRQCLDAIDLFDESKALVGIEDYDLWLRIAMRFEIGYLDETLSVYRIHDSNISSEGKQISSQLSLLLKFYEKFYDVENEFPGIFSEKRDQLLYRQACWLIKNKRFDQAQKRFRLAARREDLLIHSVLGLISCFLKTNYLFKDRNEAIHLKRCANFLKSIGENQKANDYYLASIKKYPLQKVPFKELLKMC